MNELAKKQIHDDYREILSSEAGKRIFGGIFFAARLNGVGLVTDYLQGKKDLALQIANTMREVSPYFVADCEIAHGEFIRRFDDDGATDDTDGSDDYGDYDSYGGNE